jgi:hypothetical protein
MADGDSGSNFLQNIINGGDVDAFSTEVDQMTEQAKSGGWAVNDEGGQATIKAIEDYLDRWAIDKRSFQMLSQGPPLGSGPYMKQVSHHVAKVAEGDDMSALPHLQTLEAVCGRMIDAIKIAMSKYHEIDASTTRQFKIAEGQ